MCPPDYCPEPYPHPYPQRRPDTPNPFRWLEEKFMPHMYFTPPTQSSTPKDQPSTYDLFELERAFFEDREPVFSAPSNQPNNQPNQNSDGGTLINE